MLFIWNYWTICIIFLHLTVIYNPSASHVARTVLILYQIQLCRHFVSYCASVPDRTRALAGRGFEWRPQWRLPWPHEKYGSRGAGRRGGSYRVCQSNEGRTGKTIRSLYLLDVLSSVRRYLLTFWCSWKAMHSLTKWFQCLWVCNT